MALLGSDKGAGGKVLNHDRNAASRCCVAFYWTALYWTAHSGIQFLRVRRAWSSTPLVLSLNLAMCWLTWYLAAMASALVPA
jgi:hypothetical protein